MSALNPQNMQFPYEMVSQVEWLEVLGQVFSVMDSDGKLLSEDKMLLFMAEKTEELFEPKLVHSNQDWLSTNHEKKQTIINYAQGATYIKNFAQSSKTIILKQIGNSIDFYTCLKFKAYLEAFF